MSDPALVPFSKLVDIKQVSSHEYEAQLPPDWCIGSGTALALHVHPSMLAAHVQ